MYELDLINRKPNTEGPVNSTFNTDASKIKINVTINFVFKL